MSPEEIERLAGLEAAASPGPWTKLVMGGVCAGDLRENTMAFASGGDGELFEINPEAAAYVNRFEESEEWDEIGPNCSRAAHADEALIAALRNAAPALIQAARELAALKAIAADGLKNMDNPDYTGPVVAELAAALRAIRDSAADRADGAKACTCTAHCYPPATCEVCGGEVQSPYAVNPSAATPPTSNPDDFDLRTWNPGNWDLGDV